MWVAKTLWTFHLYKAFCICFLMRKKDYDDDWSKIYPGFSSSELNQGIIFVVFFMGRWQEMGVPSGLLYHKSHLCQSKRNNWSLLELSGSYLKQTGVEGIQKDFKGA